MITIRGQILVSRTGDDPLHPVCTFKTSPCVCSKRPRVYRHHAHILHCSLDARAQILSISDRRNGVGKQCSSLHHPDMTSCLISLLLVYVNLVFLMLCYDKLFVKQALGFRIARPMCNGHPFASSPCRRLARPLFSAAFLCGSYLSVQTLVPSRSSVLLCRNC